MTSRGRRWLTGFVAVAAFLALGSLITRAIIKLSQSQGADTYQNVCGMIIHWITVLTVILAVVIALIVGISLRWWQKRTDSRIVAEVRAAANHHRHDS
jgi:hypothetical protein